MNINMIRLRTIKHQANQVRKYNISLKKVKIKKIEKRGCPSQEELLLLMAGETYLKVEGQI